MEEAIQNIRNGKAWGKTCKWGFHIFRPSNRKELLKFIKDHIGREKKLFTCSKERRVVVKLDKKYWEDQIEGHKRKIIEIEEFIKENS